MSRRRKKRRKAQNQENDPGQVELLPDMVEEGAETPSAASDDPESGDEADASGPAEVAVSGGESLDEGEAGLGSDTPVAEADVERDPQPTGGVAEAPGAGPEPPGDGPEPRGEAPKPRGDAESPPVPRPAGNQLARARDLVESGRIQEAIALYEAILAERPDNLKAHNNLGALLDELGEHERAVRHFEAALETEPQNLEVLSNYGTALTHLARYDEADDALRKAQRLAPGDLRTRLALGILAFRRGLYELAEAELHSVCDRDPEHGLAFYYRGEALNRAGRYQEAVEVMLRAAELLPGDPRPAYTLGHLYDRQNLPAEAAEMYRRARDLQTELPS